MDNILESTLDRVYLGKGSQRLHSMWIPIGDIPIELGTLLVCPGSHVSKQFEKLRKEYGQTEVGKDGVQSGWYSNDPQSMEKEFGDINWVTTSFRAGDVCVLNLDLLHMSTTNTTNKYRLSCDTRWQPAKDEIDPRLLPKTTSHERL